MSVWKFVPRRSPSVQNHSNQFIEPRRNPQLQLEIFIPSTSFLLPHMASSEPMSQRNKLKPSPHQN
jgi:hypothetical protein